MSHWAKKFATFLQNLSNHDHGDKKVTNSRILLITENNDFAYFTGECVCVRVFLCSFSIYFTVLSRIRNNQIFS